MKLLLLFKKIIKEIYGLFSSLLNVDLCIQYPIELLNASCEWGKKSVLQSFFLPLLQ